MVREAVDRESRLAFALGHHLLSGLGPDLIASTAE